ncbi:hypothetical protein [Shinella oryzae]|uniref:Uncharacterized protein n=1 Tax=Shinella oryzae TaxID=2871820 RepID=A0ABY9K4V3_9HYPH|nr:hypothetical protein [Shinella oryzae]WLS02898.1 hypothetical protein Q9315_16020 [Shinella oryzae]
MSNAAKTGLQPGHGPQSVDFINKFAETMRAESGVDLPHDYFVAEARMRLSGGVHHLSGEAARPATPETSACFDAWAKAGHNG